MEDLPDQLLKGLHYAAGLPMERPPTSHLELLAHIAVVFIKGLLDVEIERRGKQ